MRGAGAALGSGTSLVQACRHPAGRGLGVCGRRTTLRFGEHMPSRAAGPFAAAVLGAEGWPAAWPMPHALPGTCSWCRCDAEVMSPRCAPPLLWWCPAGPEARRAQEHPDDDECGGHVQGERRLPPAGGAGGGARRGEGEAAAAAAVEGAAAATSEEASMSRQRLCLAAAAALPALLL